MAQTDKAKQNQANQNQNQDDLQNQAMAAELQKLVAPIAEAVAQLKADKEQEASNKAAEAEAARQAQLNKNADISAMLDGAGVEDESEDKFEKLSKRQIVEVIAGAVETALEANAAKIKDEIGQSMSPNKDKIDRMEKALMGIVGGMAVQECRNKFDDFDDYKDDISKIMGETGVGFEDAYYVAKSRRAGKVPPGSEIDSEKPANTGWENTGGTQGGVIPNQAALQQIADRGKEARGDAGVTKSGVVGFRNLVKAAVDKIDVGSGRR